ncbi:MAG TPA: type II toxin-antitoxin system RelE/ParE family toxin [Candidatus Gastranaerophilales bacterium]|nr:type II toxin-antitoxin system RelE/ParE family toxin [Candidatus Gastranaerophilales bacterium]
MKAQLRKSAQKDLNKLDKSVTKQLLETLKTLENFPNVSNCKKLVNFDPAYIMRSGDYRILFDVVEDIIYIARILHRKDSYKVK